MGGGGVGGGHGILFENFFIPEDEMVHMVVHCLERDADAWWRRLGPGGE